MTAEPWDAEAGSFTYDANGNQLTAPAPYSLTASTHGTTPARTRAVARSRYLARGK